MPLCLCGGFSFRTLTHHGSCHCRTIQESEVEDLGRPGNPSDFRPAERNAIQSDSNAALSGSAFLDCFAGSGSVGIEALSRGAAFVAFVEESPRAVKVIRQNLALLGEVESHRCQVISQKAETGLKSMEREWTEV